MFINKNIELFIIFIIIFIYYYTSKYRCPCNKNNNELSNTCYRYEIYGIQINHIILFMFFGYFCHEYFVLLQSIGIIWEIIEMYLDKYENIVYTFGGCLKKDNTNNKYKIGKDEIKYLNPIDKYFNIKNSKIHGWHGSIAEIIINFISFFIGYYLYLIKNKYF